MGNSSNGQNTNTLAYGAIATINLDVIAENYKILSVKMSPAECSSVIKANAYGLGAERVGPVLYDAGCRIFFVAQLIEAFQLKDILPHDATIAILNGIQNGIEEECAKAGIIPVLNSFDAIERWKALCIKKAEKLPAIIQIDTGMNRLGLEHDELTQLIQNPEIFNLADIRYIMSHLASAEEQDNPSNQEQLTYLQQAISKLPACKIAFANSAGIFFNPDCRFDLARPGIALYGVAFDKQNIVNLKPVLTLGARVIQSRHVPKGTPIGYGGSQITTRKSIITTISIGYADGWHRSLSNKGSVYFNGQRLPIIGRVSMDSITLDTTDLNGPLLKCGDIVELIGDHQSLEDVARDANTIPYDILTSLSSRCEHIYIKDGKATAS